MSLPLLSLVLQLGSAQAGVDGCPEIYESCLESCHIDFGMDRARTKLNGCVERCQKRKATCAHTQARDQQELDRAREEFRKQQTDEAHAAEVQRVEASATPASEELAARKKSPSAKKITPAPAKPAKASPAQRDSQPSRPEPKPKADKELPTVKATPVEKAPAAAAAPAAAPAPASKAAPAAAAKAAVPPKPSPAPASTKPPAKKPEAQGQDDFDRGGEE